MRAAATLVKPGGQVFFSTLNRNPKAFFFFQAEDGIRHIGVTGVQTCALPISSSGRRRKSCSSWYSPFSRPSRESPLQRRRSGRKPRGSKPPKAASKREIGRAHV